MLLGKLTVDPHMLVKWISNWCLYSHVRHSWLGPQKLTQKCWYASVKLKRPACKSNFRWSSICTRYRCNKTSERENASGFKTEDKCAAFAFLVGYYTVWPGFWREIRLVLWIRHTAGYIMCSKVVLLQEKDFKLDIKWQNNKFIVPKSNIKKYYY